MDTGHHSLWSANVRTIGRVRFHAQTTVMATGALPPPEDVCEPAASQHATPGPELRILPTKTEDGHGYGQLSQMYIDKLALSTLC